MITKPDSIYQPFCSDGVNGIDYTLPPDSGADTSIVSQPLGAPEIMEEPISAGGLPLLRKQFNGVLRKYSDILLWTNAGGQFTFDSTIATKTNGYPKDTILFNPETGRFVKSLIDNNTDNFLTNPNKIDNVSWADTQVTLLGNNVNVHTLTTPGIYFQNNPAYATTALNYPFNGFTGAIQVVSVNDGLGSLSISQMATVVNTSTTNNSIYNCSNYAGSGFSAWVKQATVNQLQDGTFNAYFNLLTSKGRTELSIGNGLESGLIATSNPSGLPNSSYFGTDGAAGGAGSYNGFTFESKRSRPVLNNYLGGVLNTPASVAAIGDITANGVGIVASGSGWVKFASGFILAWVAIAAGNGNPYTITYPINFLTTPEVSLSLLQLTPGPAFGVLRSIASNSLVCSAYNYNGTVSGPCTYHVLLMGY